MTELIIAKEELKQSKRINKSDIKLGVEAKLEKNFDKGLGSLSKFNEEKIQVNSEEEKLIKTLQNPKEWL